MDECFSCIRRQKWRWFLIFPFWFLPTAVWAIGEQRFANEPSPQTAVVGSTVVLPCRVINKVGEVQWTRDDFGLGNERELYAFDRYQMIGSDEEGDFSLRISPVSLEDDAQFQCQVTGWRDAPGVRSQTAKLTVYVPPDPPEIAQGSSLTVTEGEVVQFECLSKGGKPAAELQWLDGTGRVLTEGVHYKTEAASGIRLNDARSLMSFPAGREHHNAVFTCTASSPALRHSVTKQIQLQVRFSPEVIIVPDKEGYREGEAATLTCSAKANPDNISYRWYKNGYLVPSNNSTKLVIPRITRDSNLEEITCEASNDIGVTKKVTRINIHYKPTFRSLPMDTYAELGENITLKCEVDSSPDPTIVWIYQERVVGKGEELHILATRNRIGSYTCVAQVEGFADISASASIFLKGPPRITNERQQWGNQGETVLVECIIAAASATSLSVSWTHHGKLVDLERGRYEMVQDVTNKGVRHTLVIRNAQPTDFGAYKCSVHNEYGSDVSEIMLSKKKTLPLLLLVCGVTGGVMLILVVAMTVIMCVKKNASRHKGVKSYSIPEKSINLHPTDQNSSGNESDLKVEFDQRTGSSMSNKEVDLEGWDAEPDQPSTPTYLARSHPYIYPDTFTALPVKMNGHISSNGRLNYDNYMDHTTVLAQQEHHHPPSPTRGILKESTSIPTSGGLTSALLGSSPVGNCQHYPTDTFYPMYGDYETNQDALDAAAGARGYSPPGFMTSGLGDYAFKNNCGSLPMSFQSSHRTNGALGSSCLTPTTIPRLGIPVDPSHYIMSPKTQVLEGTLATHV